jgi:hypothetical protein
MDLTLFIVFVVIIISFVYFINALQELQKEVRTLSSNKCSVVIPTIEEKKDLNNLVGTVKEVFFNYLRK